MTSCCLQSNYSSTVTLHGGPVVLRPVMATPCCISCELSSVDVQGWTKTNAFHICITSYKLVIQDHHAFRRKKWKYFILDEVLSRGVGQFSRTLSVLLGRLFDRIFLIKPVSNVHPCVHTCIRRPSAKSSFDFNEISHVCRGR